jgi:predicted adenylyl cyclase CyaB
MGHLNIEIKARCGDPDRVRGALRARGADFRGVDHQVDTYFHCPRGRLKLREGNIERSLIHYDRPDQPGPKPARVTLCHPADTASLREVLTAALGVWTVVDKRREIYFVDNVKFHVDQVQGLGSFVEIEAIDADGEIGEQKLREQCEEYVRVLGIEDEDLVTCSYSDLLSSEM